MFFIKSRVSLFFNPPPPEEILHLYNIYQYVNLESNLPVKLS